MNITSDAALAIGMNFLFAIHRPSIPEEVRLYLELAKELGFLEAWEEEDDQLTLYFCEGSQLHFDPHSASTLNFLKQEVEFFAAFLAKMPAELKYC